MRIVHVINSLATGGAERMVVQLAIHGKRAGHHVSVIVLADVDGLPRTAADDHGIPVAVAGRSLRDPRIPTRLRELTAGADMVHVHLFPAMYWAATLPRPKVFTEHSTHNRRMNRIRFRLPERWAYDRYDRIIAIGSGVERRLIDHARAIGSKTPIVEAQNGISDDFFSVRRSEPPGVPRLLAVGSLTEVKQHRVAIEAMSLLPGLALDIAGEGPLRADLEAQIAASHLDRRVKLLGNVMDVPALLRNYSLLISTSRFEGFGLVAAEAQAVGLPVVGPDVEGFNDVVVNGESGILVDRLTPEKIASTVIKALEPRRYRTLAEGALRHSRQFTMTASFAANHAVYMSVLQGPAAGASHPPRLDSAGW